jgi:hypothetical protein
MFKGSTEKPGLRVTAGVYIRRKRNGCPLLHITSFPLLHCFSRIRQVAGMPGTAAIQRVFKATHRSSYRL